MSKDRHGAKVRRRHDKPLTPCERVLQSKAVSAQTKALLRAERKALNPFDLNRRLEAALPGACNSRGRAAGEFARRHFDRQLNSAKVAEWMTGGC